MSTLRRDFRSVPHRTSAETWEAIVDLLAPDRASGAHKELLAVIGTASQLISSESAKDFPIISSGSGPQIRIYCLYGDDALSDDNANEAALAFDATAKDWEVSLPAESEDIKWSKLELAKSSRRIVVREKTEPLGSDYGGDGGNKAATTSAFQVNLGEFLKS